MRAIAELGSITTLTADTPPPVATEPSEKFASVLDKAGKSGKKNDTAEEKCPEKEKDLQSDTFDGDTDTPENVDAMATGQIPVNATMLSAKEMPIQQAETAALELISADIAELDTTISVATGEAGSTQTDILTASGTTGTAEVDDFIAAVTKNLDNTLAEAGQTQQPQDVANAETEIGGPAVAIHTDPKQSQTFAGGGFHDNADSSGKAAVRDPKTHELSNSIAAGIDSFAVNALGKNDSSNELIAAVEKAVDRFAADLQTVHVEGDTITLALDPEELGHMSITVSNKNGMLSAKIVTDNKAAANILHGNLEYYIQSLQEKGVNLERAEILYGQLDSGNQHSRNWNGNSDKSRAQLFSIGGIAAMDEDVPAMQVKDVYESSYMYYGAGDTYVPNKEYKA